LVVCSHDPSLASRIVGQLAADSSLTQTSEPESAALTQRLRSLSAALQNLRDQFTLPVFTLSAYFPVGTSAELSFDAATVPGSDLLQFVCRDASKPSRPKTRTAATGTGVGGGAAPSTATKEEEAELWTAVSTASFAQNMRASGLFSTAGAAAAGEECNSAAALLSEELSHLLSSATDKAANESESPPLKPLRAVAKRWGAAFLGSVPGGLEADHQPHQPHQQAHDSGTLDLLEDCVGLEPWRLVIAGDFIRRPSPAASTHASTAGEEDREGSGGDAELQEAAMMPLERSAVSGLEGGERAAAFFMK